MDLPHPEFVRSIDAKVADAVLFALEEDADLSAYFRGSISAYEAEDLVRIDTLRPPALAVVLDATDERRSGSNRKATLQTRLLLGIIDAPTQNRAAEGWLRARVADHIKRLLAADSGRLLDVESGEPVTEALLAFQRVPQPVSLPSGLYMTRLLVLFESDITEATGEFLP